MYNAATPLVKGQTVIYTGQGKGIRAVKIARKDGAFTVQQLWANPEVGTSYNTPVLNDDLLFGLSNGGNLFCLKAASGATGWTDSARRGRGFGSVLDAGSVMLALSSDSELIAFKAGAGKYEELARFKVADSRVYAHPVVAVKRIFVKDQNALTLWTLE
jgi:outer membrane protein assembly factor BamB